MGRPTMHQHSDEQMDGDMHRPKSVMSHMTRAIAEQQRHSPCCSQSDEREGVQTERWDSTRSSGRRNAWFNTEAASRKKRCMASWSCISLYNAFLATIGSHEQASFFRRNGQNLNGRLEGVQGLEESFAGFSASGDGLLDLSC